MDVIFDLFNIVLKLLLFGVASFFIASAVRVKRFKALRQEVEILQARISQFRLALRSKVKKKSMVFRAGLRVQPVEGDSVDNTIKSLCELTFEKGSDFQKYFETSQAITQFLHVDPKAPKKDTAGEDIENSFMCSDFKLEMDIVRLIKEMCDLNTRAIEKTELFNSRVRKEAQQLPKIAPFTFTALEEINRIFSDSQLTRTPAHLPVKKKAA